MEENKDYRAYRYGDHLTPGSELKIEHSVVCENVDISTLITMGTDSLEAMRQGSIDGEQKAYEIVVAAAKQWEQQAAATQTINRLWNIFVHLRLNIPAISGKTPITGGRIRKSATGSIR